ncbi:hypothetical protein RB653_002098 [Dictyostelium firmibasis]|uniref:Uncharacterized protein n=1 Tax=Dictyostelium firmibasis TaxID=79012 RepID=A0AAN7YYH9_9MYCE
MTKIINFRFIILSIVLVTGFTIYIFMNLYGNENPIKGSDLLTPKNKLATIEKEIKKKVVNEICRKDIDDYAVDEESKYYYQFNDKGSMTNYFLTYQYYYFIEEYNNKQFSDSNKYNLSKYQYPELTKFQSNFTPTIEEIDQKINLIKEKYDNGEMESQLKSTTTTTITTTTKLTTSIRNKRKQPTKPITFENDGAYHSLALKKFRARVWSEFYLNYWRDKYFLLFTSEKGLSFRPPRLCLPLDTSKPLLTTPYLFLHIPKCGGTTMYNHFSKHFNKAGTLQQWAHPNPSEYKKVQDSKNFIIGHFEMGIHLILKEKEQKTHNYMTMLRDPVDRVISNYFYHKHSPGDPQHIIARDNSIENWIIKSPRANNEITRVLSGITINEEPIPSNETFNMALYHLRSMRFVGITEKYSESLALFKFYTGLDNPNTNERLKFSKFRPSGITTQIIENIKQRNWMDILLYEEALKMFERQIDIVGRDNFEKQLKKIIDNSPNTTKRVRTRKSN